jgi:uncharacterized protein (DUF305 family)
MTMGGMYVNKPLNAALYVVLALIFICAFAATRQQTRIGDAQFIASMVPHHSGAVLMCREAGIEDAELARLCERIATSQRREIEQMNAIRARLEASSRT